MGVRDAPITEYARAVDGSQIAYQVVGDGAVDILVNRATYFPVDMMWETPRVARFLDRLSSFARHIWFDPRGTGASDRIPHEEGRLLETVVDDMVAVLDAAGCDRAAVLGLGVPIPLLFAATHPDRTAALVLADCAARMRRSDDYPEGLADEFVDRYMNAASERLPATDILAPSLVKDVEFCRWLERAFRLTCPPGERMWRLRGTFDVDLRQVLSAIRVPSLIINHTDRRPMSGTRYLVDHIDGAKTVEVPGADYMPFAADSVALLDAVRNSSLAACRRCPSTECWPPCCSLTLSTRPAWPPAWVTDVGAHFLVITTPSCGEKSNAFVAPGSNRLATVRSQRLTARRARSVVRARSATVCSRSDLRYGPGCIVAKSSCMVKTLLALRSTSASAWRRLRPRTRSWLPAPSSIFSQAQRSASPTEASTNSRESPEPGECSRCTATKATIAARRSRNYAGSGTMHTHRRA